MSQQYTAALMNHMMMEKLRRQNQAVQAALAGQHARQHQSDKSRNIQMTETRVYIGLNDAVTRSQLYDKETYLSTLKSVCRSFQVAFSVDVEQGGYYHEDGEYTEETSLVLILIDAERDTVQKIAQELRTRFHQESVLVTEDRIRGFYICDDASDIQTR